MKINEITADAHPLLKVKVDRRIPFQKIQRALKEMYNFDISRGRLSEALSGIIPMPPQLNRILEELLLENGNDDNKKNNEEKSIKKEKDKKEAEKIVDRVRLYSPPYSVYL